MFPVTSQTTFLPTWRKISLPDGSSQDRMWFVYSKTKDSAFCLHCTLFGLPSDASTWSTSGYRGWTEHRGMSDVEIHEKSKKHLSSQIARLQRIDSKLASKTNRLVEHHRQVLSIIIICYHYLSEDMLVIEKKMLWKGGYQNYLSCWLSITEKQESIMKRLKNQKLQKQSYVQTFQAIEIYSI